MFRVIEFILLYEGSDACLPAYDTKPQGLLKLISDEVPHKFTELILQFDPPGISASASRYDKSTPTITTEATTIKPPVPFSKWLP